ncbi:MAG: hypothetical protein IKZ87_05605 [Actinomycetaceae bacterium]|nr:hypothetical protein [Actinomycetaceae bacterium]
MGLLSRRFECEVEGERFEVCVHRNGSFDVEWINCSSDEVPSGYSTSFWRFAIPDDNSEDFIELDWKDPRVDEYIIDDVRNWFKNTITEDGRCACCVEYEEMRADDLLDREFNVTVNGREWHVKVWRNVWQAELVDGIVSVSHERDTDPDLTPEERAREDEAFTDEAIISEIRGDNRLIDSW